MYSEMYICMVYTCMHVGVTICSYCIVEMQQYINISSYRDTLSNDTVSIHFRSYRYIEYHDILMYRHKMYTYTYN